MDSLLRFTHKLDIWGFYCLFCCCVPNQQQKAGLWAAVWCWGRYLHPLSSVLMDRLSSGSESSPTHVPDSINHSSDQLSIITFHLPITQFWGFMTYTAARHQGAIKMFDYSQSIPLETWKCPCEQHEPGQQEANFWCSRSHSLELPVWGFLSWPTCFCSAASLSERCGCLHEHETENVCLHQLQLISQRHTWPQEQHVGSTFWYNILFLLLSSASNQLLTTLI